MVWEGNNKKFMHRFWKGFCCFWDSNSSANLQIRHGNSFTQTRFINFLEGNINHSISIHSYVALVVVVKLKPLEMKTV